MHMEGGKYELVIVLQPERTRSCGFGDILNRRTIDPCVVLQLGLRYPGQDKLVFENSYPP
ncbi:hypothetical protein BDEG_22182 [Batrachochytrium dendrobatidis JEL423]|uniref:Velvet domain-containing protein n=1 Tax=Batrachochytrium dendrobatidis (strain JEL423) TaxID=403673 RepID=A0A177WDW6_BATDL|nr:hypothetical protein BDEG_22182 [Batrachochytrium dendrobatidis JEL423]